MSVKIIQLEKKIFLFAVPKKKEGRRKKESGIII